MQLIYLLILTVCYLSTIASGAYYLPGVTPNSFKDGDTVLLKSSKVTSTNTPLQYDYYDLPFCVREEKGGGKSSSTAENIGERLSGDTVTTSPYELRVKKDEACVALCRKQHTHKEIAFFKQMIDAEYRVNWLLDNIPVAVRNDELVYVSRGYPVGFVATSGKKKQPQHYLFNHVRIIVRYSEEEEEFEGVRVVGFEVVPFSLKHAYEAGKSYEKDKTVLTTCNQFQPAQYNPELFQAVEDADEEVIYTYDIKWERSDLRWSNRWDVYLKGNPDDEIHYFSIVNSLMIVLFLTGVVAMIMLRTLHKDISSYNEMQTLEEAQEESGWKLVHGDVFRPPAYSPMLLSVLAGSGIQILGGYDILQSYIISYHTVSFHHVISS